MSPYLGALIYWHSGVHVPVATALGFEEGTVWRVDAVASISISTFDANHKAETLFSQVHLRACILLKP